MVIVRLKTLYRDKTMKELLKSFGLPRIESPKGYQVKPNPELTGGSAMNAIEALGHKAVN
jgi:hypothetical protein